MSYISQVKVIEGSQGKKLFLFTLSTCIWCRKTKALLKDLKKSYSYIDVDLLEGADKDEAYAKMEELAQSTSFPTIIINDGEDVVVGFEEEKIKSL
ncbi:glutaredoxin family protein [Patescibacteria group bacterium]|nr:MAG: glutaredoxin family protein [Patescibacteria group bacterium]